MPLSLAASLANDQLVLDELETIVFTSKSSIVNTTTNVPNAVRYQIPRREADGAGGFFTFQDSVWEFRVADLAVDPKEGDNITEGAGATAVVWVVDAVEKQVWDTIWRCDVHRER